MGIMEVSENPKWWKKHPCKLCGTGYGACIQGLPHNLMCCVGCDHPSRWTPDPYTDDEIKEAMMGSIMRSREP